MTHNSVTDFSFLSKQCEDLRDVIFEMRAMLNVLLYSECSPNQYSKDLYGCLNLMERLLNILEKGMDAFLEFINGMGNQIVLEALV